MSCKTRDQSPGTREWPAVGHCLLKFFGVLLGGKLPLVFLLCLQPPCPSLSSGHSRCLRILRAAQGDKAISGISLRDAW
jgi:hypothetical protein